MDIKEAAQMFSSYHNSLDLLEWLQANKLLKGGENLETLARQYAFGHEQKMIEDMLKSTKKSELETQEKDPLSDHYFLIVDDKKIVQSRSIEIIEREFSEMVTADENSLVQIKNFKGEIIKEWVDTSVQKN